MSSFLARNAGFLAKLLSCAFVAGLLVWYGSWASEAAAADAAVEEQMREAEAAARADTSQRGPYSSDGTFEGTAQGYGGPVSVAVTIENGYVTQVEVTSHDGETEPYYSMAAVLADDVVDEQTTAIDTVSGATLTSAGILNATTAALQESMASGTSGGE